MSSTIEKPEIIYGSLNDVFNKLLVKSYEDKNYFDIIVIIQQVIKYTDTFGKDLKIAIKKIGSEFTVLFEYEKNQYVVFSYDLKDLKTDADLGLVSWHYLDMDLIKPFLNNQPD